MIYLPQKEWNYNVLAPNYIYYSFILHRHSFCKNRRYIFTSERSRGSIGQSDVKSSRYVGRSNEAADRSRLYS